MLTGIEVLAGEPVPRPVTLIVQAAVEAAELGAVFAVTLTEKPELGPLVGCTVIDAPATQVGVRVSVPDGPACATENDCVPGEVKLSELGVAVTGPQMLYVALAV